MLVSQSTPLSSSLRACSADRAWPIVAVGQSLVAEVSVANVTRSQPQRHRLGVSLTSFRSSTNRAHTNTFGHTLRSMTNADARVLRQLEHDLATLRDHGYMDEV